MSTFRASYISTEQIKTRTDANRYVLSTANFVKLDPNDKRDYFAVEQAVNNWHGDTLGACMHDAMFLPGADEEFFALTTQEDGFENLNPYSILGVASLTENNSENDIRIDFLQTDPMYIDQGVYKKLPFYKWIGSALVDGIAKRFKDKTLSVFSMLKSEPFYEKKGFEKTGIAGILKRKPLVG